MNPRTSLTIPLGFLEDGCSPVARYHGVLGHRIGVQAQSIYRWERDATVPKRRHRTALIRAVSLSNAEAAVRFKAAFEPKRPHLTEPDLSAVEQPSAHTT